MTWSSPSGPPRKTKPSSASPCMNSACSSQASCSRRPREKSQLGPRSRVRTNTGTARAYGLPAEKPQRRIVDLGETAESERAEHQPDVTDADVPPLAVAPEVDDDAEQPRRDDVRRVARLQQHAHAGQSDPVAAFLARQTAF